MVEILSFFKYQMRCCRDTVYLFLICDNRLSLLYNEISTYCTTIRKMCVNCSPFAFIFISSIISNSVYVGRCSIGQYDVRTVQFVIFHNLYNPVLYKKSSLI